MGALYRELGADFFKDLMDEFPNTDQEIRRQLKNLVLNAEWYEVYDLIEFLVNSPNNSNRESLRESVNAVLSQEMAGFRFGEGVLVEITDEREIAAIEDALAQSSLDRFNPARFHLLTALELLSDRRAPDYRNSIKESISAVEAIAQILSGDPQAELGKALKSMKTGVPVRGAFRSALMSLYGYTSDAEGIRHALTDEPSLDAADAKFMLVICSAFVVYLIQKSAAPRPAS